MDPDFEIILKRFFKLALPAAALWAWWKRFSGLPLRVGASDAALAGAGFLACIAAESIGPVRFGFPNVIRRIPASLAYRCIALTFDDSPHPETTPRILDALRDANARATFFVLLENVVKWPELALRIAAEGHTIATGGIDTQSMARCRSGQIQHALKMMRREAGPSLPEIRLFRPTDGRVSRSIRHAADLMGMTIVTWSVDSGDSKRARPDEIASRIVKSIRHGAIVRLVDGSDSTVSVLPTILKRLHGRGYHLIRL